MPMLSFVAQCQKWLAEDPSVQSYLKDRRFLSKETVASSGIGYFPPRARYSPANGDPPEIDRLRGRLVVPIRSEFGKLVGMAGRIPDPNEKGWWNTRFDKGSHLYGFDAARRVAFERNKLYVLEGYFDRLVLAQHGLENSVAIMSASLGMRRIGMIARYCSRICLCFDTDQNKAGLLGCLRTLADLHMLGAGRIPSSLEVTIIRLPVGEDPDVFVEKNGLDAFLAKEEELSPERLESAEKAYEALKLKLKELRQQEIGYDRGPSSS